MRSSNENSSAVSNEPQNYSQPRKQLWGRTSMREHGTETTPVFLSPDGEASWSLISSASIVNFEQVNAGWEHLGKT